MFDESCGEMTAEDVKFTVEHNLKPTSRAAPHRSFAGNSTASRLPTSSRSRCSSSTGVWEVPSHFTEFVGYQNITSKQTSKLVGEEKAVLHPIRNWPLPSTSRASRATTIASKAVPNDWRRRPPSRSSWFAGCPSPPPTMAGLAFGARSTSVRSSATTLTRPARQVCASTSHRTPPATGSCFRWGQTTPDREDYCPTCPWVGDPKDAKSLDNARRVRLALNPARQQEGHRQRALEGDSRADTLLVLVLPLQQGLQQGLEDPRHDPSAPATGRGRPLRRLLIAGQPHGHGLRARRAGRHGGRGADSVVRSGSRSSASPKRSAPSSRRTGRGRPARPTPGGTAPPRSMSPASPGSVRFTPRAPSTSSPRGRTTRRSTTS